MAEKPSAATEALSKVEDQLTCLVCLDPYTKPKLLQCFHVYCENCLQEIAAHDQQRQHSVTCPKCRRSTPLPPTGVSGLQSAFHVHHLFDIQETLKKIKEPQKLACEKCVKTTRQATSFCRQCTKFICEICSNMHSEWEEFETHEVVGIDKVEGDLVRLISPMKELLRCPKHEEKLKLFCDTCGELICHHCTVQIHKEHNFCVIADTFESHKKEILASVEPVKKQLEVIDQVVTNLEASRKEIAEQHEIVKADFHQNFQQLHKALEDREAELAANTDQLIGQKIQNLKPQKDEVEIMQAQRKSCLHFITESVRTGSQSEVMKSKKQLVKQVKDLTENFNPDTLKVHEQASISFVPSPQLVEHCENFGALCMVSPAHCHVDGKGITIAEVGERATAVVHVCDDKNQPSRPPLSQLECKLVSTLTNETTKCTVTEQKRGQYEIAYQPTTPGLHNLQIKINGRSIRGSPFVVRVKRSIGVSGLQSAFHVHHLFDIQETLKKMKEPQKLACEKCVKTTRQATSFCRQCTKFICEICSNMHSEWEEFETHEVVGIDKVEGDLVRLVSPKKELLRCPKHDKKLKLFCDTCGELICQHCTVRIHKEHNFCVVADTFESHKKEILASVEPVKKQLDVIDQAVTNLETSRKEIAEQREIFKVDIHQSFQQLHKALEDREAELAANTDQLIEQELQNLQAQKAEVEIMQAQRRDCLHFITESVRTGSQSEVMKSKKQLVKQVKDLPEHYNLDTLKVCKQPNISFVPSPQLLEHCQNFGVVCMVSPDHCHVDGKGNTIAEVGERATSVVHVCDDKNPLQVEGQLVSTLTNKTMKCTVTERKRGQYK